MYTELNVVQTCNQSTFTPVLHQSKVINTFVVNSLDTHITPVVHQSCDQVSVANDVEVQSHQHYTICEQVPTKGLQ